MNRAIRKGSMAAALAGMAIAVGTTLAVATTANFVAIPRPRNPIDSPITIPTPAAAKP